MTLAQDAVVALVNIVVFGFPSQASLVPRETAEDEYIGKRSDDSGLTFHSCRIAAGRLSCLANVCIAWEALVMSFYARALHTICIEQGKPAEPFTVSI